MNPMEKLEREAQETAAKAKAALDALRTAKATARWTALETVRRASAVDGARWIRAALDSVIEGRPEGRAVEYFFGKARYHWKESGKKAPQARIINGKPEVVYVFTIRPAPTDSELETTWNRAAESSRLAIYATARALSAFAVPDDGSKPEAGIFIKVAQ